MYIHLFVVVLLSAGFVVPSAAAQEVLRDDLSIREILTLPSENNQRPVRLVVNPASNTLFSLMRSGEIYEITPMRGGRWFDLDLRYDSNDHGILQPAGLAFDADGTLYLLGNNDREDNTTIGVLMRAELTGTDETERMWSTVMITESYRLSRTWFDHRMNGLAVSPDGTELYLNSGSRTDHGEMYGGIREEGLTAAILRVPADAENLVLPNDREALRSGGYLFAEGTRNHYDLAFAPNGDLLGTENAGDRDDNEELNWLREGHHYGFPWQIGDSQTPQQAVPYNPATDPFVQPDRNTNNVSDTGWYFSEDPTFPAPPAGITFTGPIRNSGPDGDKFRTASGDLRDASESGSTIGTFTGHRSPLGLTFDADSIFAAPYHGHAFMLSWTDGDGDLLGRLGGDGQDLLMLDLDKQAGNYTLSATQIAVGFQNPIDAAMLNGRLYVVEYGSRRGVFEIQFPLAEPTHVDGEMPLPAHATLEANYPNPFATQTTIRYSLPAPTNVRLALYDTLGREVRTVLEATQAAGHWRVPFEASSLAPGLYHLRLTTPAGHQVRSLHIVR
ncbi:MAG: hypothetical protein RhofKO_37980 [Rhodothermales bacterium]